MTGSGLGERDLAQALRVLELLLVCILATLSACAATQFVMSLDEGIYLHGAERVLSGQQLYRDFFALTGPGTFWLYGIWFKLFGSTLPAAHTLLALEIGGICTSLYVVARRLNNRLLGLAATSVFVGLFMAFRHRLYVNHRWDSTCCILLCVALLLSAKGKSWAALLAGIFAGAAAAFTPPVLLVAGAVIVALLFSSSPRQLAVYFLLGVAIPLLTTAAVLGWQGALLPMQASFGWASSHYRYANRVPYGFVPPELGHEDISLLRRILVYVPAALPVIAIALFGWMKLRGLNGTASLKVVLAAGLAVAAACYPRIASNNLLFAAPLLLCFVIVVAANWFQPRTYRRALLLLIGVSLFGVFWTITGQPALERVDSQLGELKTSPREAQNIRFATNVISPGDTLFVYPYQPIWYALTAGINPTRYDFLQPGMMTLQDEAVALSELTAHPPDWVIWQNLPTRTVLNIWPHSDPATLHFARIEQFIRTHYSQVRPPDLHFRYAIAIFHRIQ
jgi:phage shock protein PspC (stress-responsive transcriptional regulator)